MTRFLLVILCLAFFAFALWGMRRGWRHRAERQSGLPALPSPPQPSTVNLAAELVGVYVGTTYAASWQDRVAAQGLGIRSNAMARLTGAGVVIDRQGAEAIFIPSESIIDVRLAPGLAGKVVGAGGLLVLRWRLGEAELDTGLRADDKAIYPDWVAAITERLKATHE
jgi:hypothetical protein